jgi:hypothetical protein
MTRGRFPAARVLRSVSCLLGVLGGLITLTARGQDVVTIATDRPAVTESSVVVPQGALQVESGLLATDSNAHYVLDFPETDLRYGLLAKTELRLSLPDYFHAAGMGASGFSDSSIGLKQQLGPLSGFDLSIVGFASLPTGARSETSHRYDPGVQLPWSRGLLWDLTLAGQLAFYWPTVNGSRDGTREATLLIDRQLTPPWDAFIEYAGDFPDRGGSDQLLHVGTAYKLGPHQQIDLHAAFGLSPAAPRSFVGIGYSFLCLGR